MWECGIIFYYQFSDESTINPPYPINYQSATMTAPISLRRVYLLFFTLIINLSLKIQDNMVFSKTIQLTQSNFDAETTGKPIFVKFCTSSCSHCKEMKIAWEVLEEEWENEGNVIIGTVNCDKETKLCSDYNVVGTPTLFYGTGGGSGEINTLNEYAGEMSFSKMNQWAKKVLVPECSPYNLGLCTELDRTRIEKWMTLSKEDIEQMIDGIKLEEKNTEDDFDRKMKKLQALYDDLNNDHVSKKAIIKNELKLLYGIIDGSSNR